MWKLVPGFTENVSAAKATLWEDITGSLKEIFCHKISRSNVYWNVRFADLNSWWYLRLLIEATMQAERFKQKNQIDFVY